MARLLDDLLDISRITRDKIDLRKEVVDLRRASQDAVAAVRSAMMARKVTLNVQLPDEPVLVYGDPARLQQVQVNLLVNAVKFTPAEGTINLTVACESDRAVIRVSDTGVGIPRALIGRIFDPFVQGRVAVEQGTEGMGLGLTLVRSLVELHDGGIRVRSDGPGLGSQFTVDLPLSRGHVEGRTEDGPENTSFADSTDLKVLIVEDNDDARDMMRMLLESYGYDVVTAADGLSALTSLEVERPDVAFIDIGLPELNGYEVVRRARQRAACRNTYLVALTGHGQPADRSKARDVGFDDHLTKPVDLDEVGKVLTTAASARTERG
jgi:two-component system CheB/CheR fusion protein